MFTIVESSTTISWAPAISNRSSVLFELRRALVGSAARSIVSVIASPDRLEASELRLDRLVQMCAHGAADVVGGHLHPPRLDARQHPPGPRGPGGLRGLNPPPPFGGGRG